MTAAPRGRKTQDQGRLYDPWTGPASLGAIARRTSATETRLWPHLTSPSIRHPTMVQRSHKSLGEGADDSEGRTSMHGDHSDAFGMHAEHEE